MGHRIVVGPLDGGVAKSDDCSAIRAAEGRGRGQGRRCVPGGLPDVPDAPCQAGVRIGPLVLLLDAPRNPRDAIELRECRDQGFGLPCQADRAHVGSGFLSLLVLCAHDKRGDQDGQPRRRDWKHRLETGQPRDRRTDSGEGDERVGREIQLSQSPGVKVLEVGELVRADRHGFVLLEPLNQGAGEQNRGASKRGKREPVRDDAAVHIDPFDAREWQAAPIRERTASGQQRAVFERFRVEEKPHNVGESGVQRREEASAGQADHPVERATERRNRREGAERDPEAQPDEHEASEEREIRAETPRLVIKHPAKGVRGGHRADQHERPGPEEGLRHQDGKPDR